MPKVQSKSKKAVSASEATKSKTSARKKTSNKTSGYQAQVDALKPKSSKLGRIKSVSVKFTKVHVWGSKSYAELEMEFWDGKNTVTERFKVKFAKPSGADDWDTADLITDGLLNGSYLDGKSFSPDMNDLRDDVYKKSLLAVRDDGICNKPYW